MLADRLPGPLALFANISVAPLGFVWVVATFFVVPVLALEDIGAGAAFARSKQIIRRHWGESAAGVVGINLVAGLAALLGLALAARDLESAIRRPRRRTQSLL